MNNLSEEEQLKARIKELDELVDELTSILDLKKETIVEMQNAYETLEAHDEMLIATVDKLKEDNKKLVECVKFYADRKKWTSLYEGIHKYKTLYKAHRTGSKRARQVLKEIGEE